MIVPSNAADIHKYGELLRDIESRGDERNDTFVVITGNTGEGKSTLGLTVAYKRPNFSNANISLDFKEIERNVRLIPRGGTHLIDEPNELHSMNFRTKSGVALENLFINSRAQEHLTILCAPYIAKILKVILLRSHYWLHIPYRGTVFVFKGNPWSMGVNKYGIDLKKLDKVVSEDTFIQHVLKPAQLVGAFRGGFTFKQYTHEMDKGVFEEYYDAKTRRFIEGDNGNNGQADRTRNMLGEMIYSLRMQNPNKFSYRKQAQILSFNKPSYETLRRLADEFKSQKITV